MSAPTELTPLPEPASRPWRFRGIAAAIAVLVLAAAALFLWRPWEERVFAADEVPADCARTAAAMDLMFLEASEDAETRYDHAGAMRVEAGGSGTTLECAGRREPLLVWFFVEYWADGTGAATGSFARTRMDAPDAEGIDVGDDGVFLQSHDGAAMAAARTGNVIVQIRVMDTGSGEVTEAEVVRLLEALLDAVEA